MHRSTKSEKQEVVNKPYDDFDWVGMFHKRTLDRLTVPMLNLFLERHHLAHGKMKKPEKVPTIPLANSQVHRIQDVGFPDGNDSDAESDSDVVLMEVGKTSDDDDNEGESEDAHPQYSRGGRLCNKYMTRHFFRDSD